MGQRIQIFCCTSCQHNLSAAHHYQPTQQQCRYVHSRTKKPPKERLGCGEGFPQRHQQEHQRRARSGVLQIAATCNLQLSGVPASRIHHQPQDESLTARRERNHGTEGALQQRVGIRFKPQMIPKLTQRGTRQPTAQRSHHRQR